MPAEVKILIKGYTNADSVAETGVEKTCPTITLVKDKDLVMVVDPGVLPSRHVLVDALGKENLSVEDVNFVCITHSHIDHYRNIGMFQNARVLEFFGIWYNDTVEDWQENFTENIQIVRTPGHDYTGITLFVKTKNEIVAICGDIFWKENYPMEDKYASEPEKLKESREMVLKMAEWIIPGHGDIYKTNKIPVPEKEKMDGAAEFFGVETVLKCRRCGKIMDKKNRCICRTWLCHHCCECGIDCDLCGCSHKK